MTDESYEKESNKYRISIKQRNIYPLEESGAGKILVSTPPIAKIAD
jgi:hypothetical protein